jgi:hypothetical protein
MNERAQKILLHLLAVKHSVLDDLAVAEFFPRLHERLETPSESFFILYFSNENNMFSAEKFEWNPESKCWKCYDADEDLMTVTRAPLETRDDMFFYQHMAPVAIYLYQKNRVEIKWSLLGIYYQCVEEYFKVFLSNSAITREMTTEMENVFFSILNKLQDRQVVASVIEELISVLYYFPKLQTLPLDSKQ